MFQVSEIIKTDVDIIGEMAIGNTPLNHTHNTIPSMGRICVVL